MVSTEKGFEYETAFDLLVRLRTDGLFLNTCLPDLNGVLQLYPGRCYELDGDVGTGKTQICYSLAAKFLQSRNTARIGWISAIPIRTDHLCQHLRLNDRGAVTDHLDRLICKQVEKTNELRESLNSFAEMVNMHFVVVENIDALLHDTAYAREMGRSVQLDISERLKKLTRAGVTVVVTNHITHWRGYPAPALGVFWASQIKNRFYVSKQSEDSNVRSVSTMNEDGQGTKRAEFRINDNGLESVNDK